MNDGQGVGGEIQALIFDLDGTLVDTLAEIELALNKALDTAGQTPCSRADVRAWVGDGPARLVEKALPRASPNLRREVLEEFVSYSRDRPLGDAMPYEGVEALLRTLHAARFPLAVLSNKLHQTTTDIVRALFDERMFVSVLGLVDEETKKPDGRRALEIVDAFGLRPYQVAMVGDTAVDVETAVNAGLRSVAVTWGFRDPGELRSSCPTWMVSDPLEILEIVGMEDE